MAVLTPQSISTIGTTVTYTAPSTSDTVVARANLIYHIKTGGTGTTVTIVVPGTQSYSEVATTEIILVIGTTQERMFYLHPGLADANGNITITMTSVTTVTSAVLVI